MSVWNLNNAEYDVVSNNSNTSLITTYTFDIMSTSTTTTCTNNNYTNDVALSSSDGSTTAATDWLNLSSSPFPAGSALRPTAPVNKKSRRGPRSRSSQYRGVTFYRRTGRWESHIWDCGKQEDSTRLTRQLAIKFRGTDADINFNIADYQQDIVQMKNLSKEEFVHILRRQTTGFVRRSSKYRGVALHTCGRWEARMAHLLGKKAYDVTALRCNGSEAATNFEPSTFDGDLASHANKYDVSGAAFGHDLDLSLNIHTSSEYNLKWNDASSSKAWNDPKVLVYSTSAAGKSKITPPYGQPITSTNYPAMLLAKHSGGYFPMSYEVHSTVAPSSSRMPNWGWKHPQGHYSTTSTGPPPFSSAASSGFSLHSYVTPTTSTS